MKSDTIREYCLSKRGATECFPFDETTLVFKVKSKMFCLLSLVPPISINLKCDPGLLPDLIERYDFVQPGYHMNKRHWVTVDLSFPLKTALIYEWIDNSYDLVVKGLSKKDRGELNI